MPAAVKVGTALLRPMPLSQVATRPILSGADSANTKFRIPPEQSMKEGRDRYSSYAKGALARILGGCCRHRHFVRSLDLALFDSSFECAVLT